MEIFAPIILFVYNRPEYTRRTLEALVKADCAAECDLFVFADGAKGPGDEASVRAVRKVLQDIKGFKSVEIQLQSINLGLSKSVINGVSNVLLHRERAIIVEDDLIVTPGFLAFMQQQLIKQQPDLSIWAVSGYSFFSHPWMPETYALGVMSSWGWATWKDRWEKVIWDASELENRLNQRKTAPRFDFAGFSYRNLLKLQREGSIDSWAIRFYTSMYLNGGLCLFPGSSLVANNGFDGSGTHTFGKNLWHEPVVEKLSQQLAVSIPRESRLLRYIVERHVVHKRRNPVV